jgi:hypothetical protein
VQAPAPKAAAKKAAAPAEGGMGAAKGFTGVPSEYGRPVINMPTGFPASSDTQTVSCTPLSASPKFVPFSFSSELLLRVEPVARWRRRDSREYHARTHARTHTHTHANTHAHTHAR